MFGALGPKLNNRDCPLVVVRSANEREHQAKRVNFGA